MDRWCYKADEKQEARLPENACTLADLETECVSDKSLSPNSHQAGQYVPSKAHVMMGTVCSFLQELVAMGFGDNRMSEMSLEICKSANSSVSNFESPSWTTTPTADGEWW